MTYVLHLAGLFKEAFGRLPRSKNEVCPRSHERGYGSYGTGTLSKIRFTIPSPVMPCASAS